MQHDHLVALARELSLSGLADALDRQRSDPQYSQMPFTERLAAGLVAERERRTSSRLARIVKDAHLPEKAAPEELINSEIRGLNPEGMRDLLKCDWIDHAWNILISGETGAGKTWIAACVAMAAIRAEHKAKYYKLSDLLYELSLTHGDGTYIRESGKGRNAETTVAFTDKQFPQGRHLSECIAACRARVAAPVTKAVRTGPA